MNYLSVCSGVEAATVAWHGLGFNPLAFSEIEPFPSAVLSKHYPNIPNMGDMTKYKEWNLNGTVELLVGGTPCQSFSVAGLRKGIEDPRGNLALVYCGLLDHFRPKWFVWENVPGVLSSSGGRDFGSFLGAVAELGYGFAYRVLDAQHFGVPQRRRRVFVVGCLGGWEPASKVLFDTDCLSGNHKKSRKEKQGATSLIERGIAYGGSDPTCSDTVTRKWHKGSGGPSGNECGLFVAESHVYETHPADSRVKEMGDVCQTVTSRWGTGGGNTPLVQQAYSIREDAKANNFSATPLQVSTALKALQPSVQSHHAQTFIAEAIPINDKATRHSGGGDTRKNDGAGNGLGVGKEGDPSPKLTRGDKHAVFHDMKVRKLTPKECERLQGFPDDYTNIEWRGKEEAPDGHRYKAMGNSMAVPVMKWIGERIANVELY